MSDTNRFEDNTFIRADRIRLTGHPTLNAAWLGARIVEDPSILGMGDVKLVDEGRVTDGRLELLLRDPATGRRFTTLIRIGPAEDGDIVRAIENWTIERGRYPEHEHFAVIVAEELPRRFLSAVNTLGGTFPLSAVQVSALRVGKFIALDFAPVIDRMPIRATHIAPATVPEALLAPSRMDSVESSAKPAKPAAIDEPAVTFISKSPPAFVDAGADAAVVETVPPIIADPLLARVVEPLECEPASADAHALVDEIITAQAPIVLPDWLSEKAWERSREEAEPRRRGVVFAAACVLSLLLCVAAVVGWIRSFGATDVYAFEDRQGHDHVIYSEHGRLEWIAPPKSGDPAGARYVKIPYWLPAGITAILPFAWCIRRSGRSDFE